MMSDWRRLSYVGALAALLLSTGCPSGTTPSDTDAGAGEPDTDQVDVADYDAATAREREEQLPPVESGDLAPTFWQMGPTETLPEGLVVDFSTDIRHESGTPVGDQTEIRVEPDIEGTWRLEDKQRLVFRPEESFDPGESYDVVVESVEVRRRHPATGESVQEKVTPETPWQHTFQMPDFEFIELLTPVARRNQETITVDLRFSAPPEAADLAEWLTWQVAGRNPGKVTYSRKDDSPHVVRAEIAGLDLEQPGAKITVRAEIAAGVPFDDETTAPATEAAKEIVFGEEVTIEDLGLKEGPDGFYVRVVCDDESVSGERDFYNLITYEDYDDISPRCIPDLESAREHIEFDPEVGDISISPAQGGFRILGDFERGTYSLSIKPGLTTVDGGVVDEITTEDLEVGPRSALAETVGTGRYIPPEAWNHLAVRHRNVDAVRVEVRHVPEKNLVFWLGGYGHDADSQTSNLIAREVVAVDGEPDETSTSYVDLDNIVDEREKGVYAIEIEGLQEVPPSKRSDDEDKWDRETRDTSRLVLTDVNLVAKRAAPGPDEAWSRTVEVWTRDMRQNEPLSGVEVKAVRQSGYVLGTCTTTGGHCELDIEPKKLDPNGPFALIASTDDDLTFLEYSDLRTEVPRADIGGDPYLSDRAYRVAMYGDRDLYRPAETLHVAGVVRKARLGRARSGVPVELELTDPQGQSVRKRVVKTNAAGAFEFDYEFGDYASTGRWRLEATIGNEESGEYSFFVEEFVPERMEVSVDPKRKHVLAGEEAEFDVQADYLFGAPAADSKVKLGCSLQPTRFSPDGYPEYHFGHAPFEEETRDIGSTSIGSSETTADEEGAATIGCGGTEVVGEFGARVDGQVSVLEAGSGRSTDERSAVWVHPEEWLVGLKSNVDEIEEGETFRIDGAVATWEGEPATQVDQVDVELIQLDRVHSWYRDRYGYESDSDWREILAGRRTVDVENGEFDFKVTPEDVEDAFAVRVRAGEATTTLQLDTDYYYWGYRGDDTPDPQTPSHVPVEVDGPIEVGAETTVNFEAPFDGRALVTVETHGVRKFEWIEVDAGSNQWSFSLDEFAPNVYVTALVLKNPHIESDDAFVPRRAFGVSSVDVVPKQYRGEVALDVPDEKRPGDRFDVEVDADMGKGPTWATVAVVDEGILQLTDYESPNPLETLLVKRALGVDTFDTVGWNVRMPSMGDASGGGAARRGGGQKGRAMPVEPVALWSGLVKLEEGQKTIPFKLPNYRGEVRVMAVAISPDEVASTDASMKVRDPLGLKATTPRFLTSGDRADIPVFLTNQTGSEKSIDVSMSSRPRDPRGMMMLTERGQMLDIRSGEQTVTLADGQSTTVDFPIEAVAPSGAAELTVKATAEGHESTTSSTVPLNPADPEERELEMMNVDSGTMDLTPQLDGWVPRSERTTFRLTTLPFGDVLEQLDYLVDYPYGCIEQTTSSTRPLLFLGDLVESVSPQSADEFDDTDEMVDKGIDRILSMQVPAGGFGYWPGSSSPDAWGTAYAVDLLLDARDQGYDVPDSRLDSALSWLESEVDDYERSSAYMHYVLARADRGDRESIREAITSATDSDEEPSGSEAERIYLLKAALYLAGDRKYEEDLEDLEALAEAAEGQDAYGGTYYSGLRRAGLALTIYYNLFGRDDTSQIYLKDLVERMRDEWRLNTQEAAWGVTALGKAIDERKVKSELRGAELTVDGEKVEPTHRNAEGHPTWSVYHAADRNSVRLDVDVGEGTNWYLVVDSKGVKKSPTVEYGDEGMQIRREYLDADGNEITPSQIELGDLFYVRLDVSNTQNDEIDNVAIVDRLPAGLEIENPRLSGSRQVVDSLVEDNASRRGGSWWYDHMNVRDDRLQVFGDLPDNETRQVVYAVRATLPGTFKQPLVEAHAMYVPGEWSRQRGGMIRIQSR